MAYDAERSRFVSKLGFLYFFFFEGMNFLQKGIEVFRFSTPNIWTGLSNILLRVYQCIYDLRSAYQRHSLRSPLSPHTVPGPCSVNYRQPVMTHLRQDICFKFNERHSRRGAARRGVAWRGVAQRTTRSGLAGASLPGSSSSSGRAPGASSMKTLLVAGTAWKLCPVLNAEKRGIYLFKVCKL